MIGLKGGLVSLALFIALIVVAMLGIMSSLLKLDKNDERHVLGRALLATILGVLFIIGTVSPIFFVYPIYWCLAGMAVGSCLIERGKPATKKCRHGPGDAQRATEPVRGARVPKPHEAAVRPRPRDMTTAHKGL